MWKDFGPKKNKAAAHEEHVKSSDSVLHRAATRGVGSDRAVKWLLEDGNTPGYIVEVRAP